MKRNFTYLTGLFYKKCLLLLLSLSLVMISLSAQDMVTVAGLLQMEDGDPTPGVMISVNDGEYVTYTDEDGYYSLSLPAGGDYVIEPVKEDEVLQGVSTLDVVFLLWHVLGINSLNSPFKQFAADVNHSQNVSTLDVVSLHQAILLQTAFPYKKPWYFFYLNGSGIGPEQAVFTNLTQDQFNVDFAVVKTGDLNDSAFNFGEEQVSVHSEEQLLISIEDRYITSGETFTVDFVAESGKVLGYQFTIDFDDELLSLEGLIPGVAEEDNFGTDWASDGIITTSWTSPEVQDLRGQALFSLVFKSAGSAWLSDLLNVSSSYTSAEAYNGAGEIIPVELYAKPASDAEEFVLYQNSPNPFTDKTAIAFDLPEGGVVNLQLLDASGKALYDYEAYYPKGHHVIELQPQAKGLLFCRLRCGEYVAVRKMQGL